MSDLLGGRAAVTTSTACITTEPEARRMASHHDAQHRRSQR